MKFIELFAGIGAFRLGLERTGHECVWSNEWLDKPRSIYAKNFGEEPDGRDIRDVTARDIPDADLLVGGFPCATFSIAGKRTGFSLEDTRGTLAFEMFRLARDKKIPYILFENVKGLLNHDQGRTFKIILEVLDGMGYDCQWELLDSQNFGVPQHRERIFLIGHLRGKPRPKVFPIGITGPEDDGPYQGEQENRQYVDETFVTQWRRGHFRDYKSKGVPTLTANMGTGGHNVPFVKKRVEFVGAIGEPRKNSKEKDYDKSRAYSQSNRVFDTNGVSPSLAGTEKSGRYNIKVDMAIRKLTPLECERLQGLPDGWTEFYADGTKVSDSQRYERCGRTITIPVVEAIGRKLHEFY